MANFLAAAHQNAQDIGALQSRIDDLERIINGSLGKWSKYGTRSGKRSTTPEEKVRILSNRAIEMEKDRSALIAFNIANASRDPADMIRWTDRTMLKSGKERMMSFTQVDDNTSLKKLIQSEYREVLNNSLEGEEVNITTNIFKKYWVVIIDNKLVPLCRDFKGGLGREYLWTSDEDMAANPPSTDWKNESKKKNDPRREMIDPQTMELWVPEDELPPPLTQSEHEQTGGEESGSEEGNNHSVEDENEYVEDENEEGGFDSDDESSQKRARID